MYSADEVNAMVYTAQTNTKKRLAELMRLQAANARHQGLKHLRAATPTRGEAENGARLLYAAEVIEQVMAEVLEAL